MSSGISAFIDTAELFTHATDNAQKQITKITFNLIIIHLFNKIDVIFRLTDPLQWKARAWSFLSVIKPVFRH